MTTTSTPSLFGDYTALVRCATDGFDPYDYQCRLAEDGLPEVLAVPTGAGKTQAAVLGWLYRRRFHPDPEVRLTTPRWLIFVLPMRVLAEQTVSSVRAWLDRLGLADDVACHLVMGGEPRTSPWRMAVDRDTVIVGTLDMIVSRMLNRGYGESRFVWPIDFGLFNNGCQFVFDEVQLMGPALATTRQLHGLRQRFGEAAACHSMWMSATVPEDGLRTVDAPGFAEPVVLSSGDRAGPLAQRLNAPKSVRALAPSTDPKRYAANLASHALNLHRPGSLTLIILNTVMRARDVYRALITAKLDAQVVLLHSRFRPDDRRLQVELALAPVDRHGPGRIVVSTQVIEAGVDVSAAVLVTEAAPWPSIVQRAGRCNRDGLAGDAVLAWVMPPTPTPYLAADVEAARIELTSLEDVAVTPATLRDRDVHMTESIVPVLRAKDLLELFDTAPDLGGNDIDVARFIRDADDLDVVIAWRPIGEGPGVDEPLPARSERCPVPVAEAHKFASELWYFDHLDRLWRRATSDHVRPGSAFLADVSFGRYRPETGWDSDSKAPVVPIEVSRGEAPDERALDDDPASFGKVWLPLTQHLAEVEEQLVEMLDALHAPGLSSAQAEAAAVAGRYHDVGKVHPAFQRMLRASAAGGDRPPPPPNLVLAKSAGSLRARNDRPHFRHELASVLMLLGEGAPALDGVEEPDLVRYLIGAHHGRIRVGCRPHPDERPLPDGTRVVLGVHDGERLPAVSVPDGLLPSRIIDLGMLALGAPEGQRSWTARALALRDRADLGVFRLGFLEALVRLADWRASAQPGPVPEWSDDA